MVEREEEEEEKVLCIFPGLPCTKSSLNLLSLKKEEEERRRRWRLLVDVFERADEEVCLCLWRIDVDTVWCIKCSLTQHLCEESSSFGKNKWASCGGLSFFKFARKKIQKKNKFQGFTNGVKKRKSWRVMRRETKKKEKFPKAKQTCQKFVLPPSFLGERECACERVCACATDTGTATDG